MGDGGMSAIRMPTTLRNDGSPKLLFVGGSAETHVARSMTEAATAIGLDATLLSTKAAYAGSGILAKLAWRILDKRPLRLTKFSGSVVEHCEQLRSEIMLSTGISPITLDALNALRSRGVTTVNFQTDDPWNPSHRTRWFLDSLRGYDVVFTPRRATIQELSAYSALRIEYLPFAYDERLFFDENSESAGAVTDVILAGAADADRLPFAAALASSGLSIDLYGAYWNRHSVSRPFDRGVASAAQLRAAHARAKVGVGLVRRANRDGHSMRTFELPAMGICTVMEDTEDHRRFFGEDGSATLYFSTPKELVAQCQRLCRDDALRSRLRTKMRSIILCNHTYRDRVLEMLQVLEHQPKALA